MDPVHWSLQLSQALTADYNEPGRIHDILPCGFDPVISLRNFARSLIDDAPIADTRIVMTDIDALSATAHNNMKRAARQSDPYCWRRLYTETCILSALALVRKNGHERVSTAVAALCISKLDHAIVIAGAPGEGRLDLILDFINKIQSQYFPATSQVTDLRVHESEPSPPPPAPGTVPVLPLPTCSEVVPCPHTPPSFTAFQRDLCHQPFILREFIRDWPAMNEHPWSSQAYLRAVAGPGRIVPVEVGHDYRADDWSQTLMNWDDFLNSGFSPPTDSQNTSVLYLAQHSLLTQFPALRSDIIVPDYVYASPSAPPDFPEYKPPGNEDQLVVNAWLGPKGTVSPPHTDPYFNFYAQVVGCKTVWLAPPGVTPFMYPYPPAETTMEQDGRQSHNPAANNINPSMSNTSRVDVFLPAPDDDRSRREFPLLWKNVIPHAMSATLEPGDLLFFPPGWWHAMKSETTSFSVSMWF